MLTVQTKVIAGSILVATLVFAWMYRYETVIPNRGWGHYKTDRWTGTTYFCGVQISGDNKVINECVAQ